MLLRPSCLVADQPSVCPRRRHHKYLTGGETDILQYQIWFYLFHSERTHILVMACRSELPNTEDVLTTVPPPASQCTMQSPT
jgi:hypothetical protein